ncbi:MAG: endonuclease MutS2 [Nitrospinae bacterium]|nr:endonuclease MutS2 [Nitrospinota bacterium]
MDNFLRCASLLGVDMALDRLKSLAATEGGKALADNLRPSPNRQEAEKLLDETAAMVEIITTSPDFDIEPAGDILAFLSKAGKGHTLVGQELRAFLPLLNATRRVKHIFDRERVVEGHPLYCDLPLIHGVAELIEESIDEDGMVRPDATPEIERLYDSANGLKQTIRNRAETMLRDIKLAPMLQEDYVTLRENRFVLPVRAEHKNHVEGIIHDSSNTGQTFYIEPKALVEMNNRLKEAEMALAAEIARLLMELTSMLAAEAEPIKAAHASITRLDLIFAKARLAKTLACSRPLLQGPVNLRNAANPVMLLESRDVVRNDIGMPEGARTLMISGPNTGGKTVILKTIGAIGLMARMGLFITAEEGSSIPFYNEIFVDIGDAQSIHDSLSTFSAHLVTLKDVLAGAGEGSLVLLDELMVSTDPKEGSALALAALDNLAKSGADVVVTTHFGELKMLAQSQPGYHNASMEFDTLLLKPTYRLVSGVPGASSAIAVAERLGLPSSIVAQAKTYLEGGDERLEKAMEALREEKILMERARREAEKARDEAGRALRDAERIKQELAEARQELAKTAKRKVSADVAAAKSEIWKMVEEVKTKSAEKETARRALVKLDDLAAQAKAAAAPEETIERARLKTGDMVYVVPLERKGEIVAGPEDGKLEVQFGGVRVTARLEDVVGIDKDGKPKTQEAGLAEVYAKKRPPHAGELVEVDLRGMRVEEGLDELGRQLDDAVKNRARAVRIIHGKGSGAMRNAVREYLSTSRYVESFRPGGVEEGGDGVTVIEFKG